MEIRATVADDIISGRFIRQGAPEALIDIGFIYCWARYVWFAYHMFVTGHWISIIYPALSAVLALLAGGSFRYLVLERSARGMRAMFSSYLLPKLEASAKYYGITWLVGESTRRLALDACRYRELDKIRVIGRQLPITIYEPQLGPAALSAR